MSKEKFNKKVLYAISLIIDVFSFVKIKEIQIPEPFTDHSLLWEAAVFIHKKIMSELLLFLTHKEKNIWGNAWKHFTPD